MYNPFDAWKELKCTKCVHGEICMQRMGGADLTIAVADCKHFKEVDLNKLIEERDTLKKEYKYNKGFEAMKDNICDTSCGLYPASMEAQEALNILISYLLGDNWYVVDPLNTKQVNAIAVEQILDKYSKKWKKDWTYFEKQSENFGK